MRIMYYFFIFALFELDKTYIQKAETWVRTFYRSSQTYFSIVM